jgi:hypothetical protein
VFVVGAVEPPPPPPPPPEDSLGVMGGVADEKGLVPTALIDATLKE